MRLGSLIGTLAAALVALSSAGAARAEDGSRITLPRALTEGARRGPPALEGARVRDAAAAFAREPGAGLPSPPQVTLLAGARRPSASPAGPEVALTVLQEISPRGLGAARRGAAEWAALAATSDLERARVEGALVAALAWVELLEAQELGARRAASVEAAAKVARLAEIRAAAGSATGAERALAAAEVGVARVDLLDAEGRATDARLGLALATGAGLGARLIAEGALDAPAEPTPDAQKVLAAVAGNPALRAAEARSRQLGLEGAVVHAAAGPTFSLGATAWREGSGDVAAAALVSVPIPLFDPARYDRARLGVAAAAAAGYAARLRAELERAARAALHDRQHAREVLAELQRGVVGPLHRALDGALTGYAAGAVELSVVLLARRALLASEERAVVAAADVLRADLRAQALGGALPGGAS